MPGSQKATSRSPSCESSKSSSSSSSSSDSASIASPDARNSAQPVVESETHEAGAVHCVGSHLLPSTVAGGAECGKSEVKATETKQGSSCSEDESRKTTCDSMSGARKAMKQCKRMGLKPGPKHSVGSFSLAGKKCS